MKTKSDFFSLPPYYPQLNPVEYQNNSLKQNVHKYHIPTNESELLSNVTGFMSNLSKHPEIVQSYFKHPEVRYIQGI
jgi:hypothetical protein